MSIKLCVDGLPGSWTEKDLRELVSPFGPVLKAQVEGTGRIRYGYVVLSSDEEADRAIRGLHRSVVRGSRLLVRKE